MANKITTGSKDLDRLLKGGYDKDIVTTIYGPAGSGKTLFCLLTSIHTALSKKKVIFVDTEGGFSLERLQQLTGAFSDVLQQMIFFRPTTFREQKDAFDKLRKVIDNKVGLVVIDTISMLYRLELGKSDNIYDINRELGKQIAYLNEIARKKNIPILLTNQVYADFENKCNVKMVGGDILKYGSKCLIELKNFKKGLRAFVLRKHRSISEGRNLLFRISERGIETIQKKNIF